MALDVLPRALPDAHMRPRATVHLGRRLWPSTSWPPSLTGGCGSAASAPTAVAPQQLRQNSGAARGARRIGGARTAEGALIFTAATTYATARRSHGVWSRRTVCRARKDIPGVKLAEAKVKERKEVLPYVDEPPQLAQWPEVLAPMKREPDMALQKGEDRQRFAGIKGRAVRQLMQTYLRMQDVGRILRLGIQDPEGDGRGWAAVALVQLKRFKEAAQLAAGPDGQTPCGYQTLRYVAHALAKAGALEAAMHLSRLQRKCGRTKFITAGAREIQSVLEAGSLYLQSTAQNMPKLLAAHGAQVSMEVEKMLEVKDDILAITPHRRFLMLTEAFNQLIRWYGRARLVPQALRACEIMNELGIPRDDMTIHFLSRGAAQQYTSLKRAKKYTQVPPDWPGKRPEVVFIGRTNSGKSAIINALFSTLMKVAPSSKTRAWTRWLDFYEVNRERAGLPHFMMVDTPGLGHADVKAEVTRSWPELIYTYLRRREALKHVFHLCDARNKKLLPADKQLIHLLASAQRRRVRYTIVITKIDVCTRQLANFTAQNIREELGQYCDVDIMFASARSLRGIDQLWSKIWQSVTETPRGKRHKELGAMELHRLRQYVGRGMPREDGVADVLGLPKAPPPDRMQAFDDAEEWAEDEDIEPVAPGQRRGPEEERYFGDHWDQELLGEDTEASGYDSDLEGLDQGDENFELGEDELEQRWRDAEATPAPEAATVTGAASSGWSAAL